MAEKSVPAQGSYTSKQGQYLAFIYYYTKIHGRSPSEADMQDYFRVSPPSVHQMVLNLEKLGFIERTAYRPTFPQITAAMVPITKASSATPFGNPPQARHSGASIQSPASCTNSEACSSGSGA